MCGISGFFSYRNTIEPAQYYAAHKKLAHRGPDDEGFVYLDAKGTMQMVRGDDTIEAFAHYDHIVHKAPSSLILGHRRLSVIDLSYHGHQPFRFEGLCMTYNGELFNYIELRTVLIDQGYQFETDTDTEVFLKAYHCWGYEAFNRFNGMWAAAIYDSNKNELILTRDRFGIKPLYYTTIEDTLFFGSEIKFLTSFMDKLYPNEQRVYDFLRFNYLDHTDETLFRDIFQVEPNSYLVFFKNGRKKVGHYWSFDTKDTIAKEEVKKKLQNAVALRLRSDVEVGSLLSGGIDSSTILGMIDTSKSAETFDTFSAVFEEESFSEKRYIDLFTTKHLKLHKHYIYPKVENFVEEIERLLETQEEPFRSLAVFSQFEIYRYIKEKTHVTVLLNGQGADEIFSGYTEHYYTYLLELLRTGRIKKFLHELDALAANRGYSYGWLLRQLSRKLLSRYIRKSDKYKIFTKKYTIPRQKRRFTSLLADELWNDLTVSALREYLRYEDKNSMAFSLESRLPFLDFRLVETALSLRDDQRIQNGLSKVMLRQIAQGMIPEETRCRKDKTGFVSPQELWQKTVLKEEFDQVFDEIRKEGIFACLNHHRIYELYTRYTEGRFNDWGLIWRFYILKKWQKKWQLHG